MRKETIGNCELFLGDALEIMPTLGGGMFDAIVTDPPYGMAFQSNHRAEKHLKIANDSDDGLLIWACGLPAGHSKYIFCRWDNFFSIPKPKSCIKWVKNNWSMGDLDHEHGRMTEEIAFYPGPNHYFPGKRPTDVIYGDRTGNEYHPTQKPIDVMSQIISWTSGTVFDPFLGSGTTGVSCAKLNRPFIGIELHEPYFEVACRRIEEAHKQGDMFLPAPKKPVQEGLF